MTKLGDKLRVLPSLLATASFTHLLDYSFLLNCRGVELAGEWTFFLDFHKVEGW